MFIANQAGNDCVDLFFGKCILRAAGGGRSIGSRKFAFAFVDDFILERHS